MDQKLRDGLWADNGIFLLKDAWQAAGTGWPTSHPERRRRIPTWVKVEVWKRDAGRCVICGATDDLQFDHDLPYALGGTSMTAQNVHLLCASHNRQKGARLT